MAIIISGENNNDKILASDGVIDSLSSLNIAGIATATTFVGNLTGNVTGDVGGNLTGNVTGNINNTTLLLQSGGYERVRITSNGAVIVAGTSAYSDGTFGEAKLQFNTKTGNHIGACSVACSVCSGCAGGGVSSCCCIVFSLPFFLARAIVAGLIPLSSLSIPLLNGT